VPTDCPRTDFWEGLRRADGSEPTPLHPPRAPDDTYEPQRGAFPSPVALPATPQPVVSLPVPDRAGSLRAYLEDLRARVSKP
jgi:hypothetical protein